MLSHFFYKNIDNAFKSPIISRRVILIPIIRKCRYNAFWELFSNQFSINWQNWWTNRWKNQWEKSVEKLVEHRWKGGVTHFVAYHRPPDGHFIIRWHPAWSRCWHGSFREYTHLSALRTIVSNASKQANPYIWQFTNLSDVKIPATNVRYPSPYFPLGGLLHVDIYMWFCHIALAD